MESDTFSFNVDTKLKPPMRQGILSVFDPLRLAAPFVLTSKRPLRDLRRPKLGWDDPISLEDSIRWKRWLAELPKLSQFSNRALYQTKRL